MTMKLINKTLLYYLVICVPLMLGAAFLAYGFIKSEVREGTEESLQKEKARAGQLIRNFKTPQTLYLGADSLSVVSPAAQAGGEGVFVDTMIYDALEKEKVHYLILKSHDESRGTAYSIRIARPLLEDEELVEALLPAFGVIAGFLLVAFFLVNIFLSKTLWRPFNKTLSELDNYSVTKHPKLELEEPGITEFRTLNATITAMTDKISRDYIQQKEFAENASHEMQTPLAIIRASLENMLQSTAVGEEELKQLQSIEKAVQKLASLNKALLLLAKIENNQFSETVTLSLEPLLAHLLEDYGILYGSKEITYAIQAQANVALNINPVLAELLIGNLVKNAFRHNMPGGKIEVQLRPGSLMISNTGEALTMDAGLLFQRFKKNDASGESLGLGLSIVSGIAALYGYSVSYAYAGGLHRFDLRFSPTAGANK